MTFATASPQWSTSFPLISRTCTEPVSLLGQCDLQTAVQQSSFLCEVVGTASSCGVFEELVGLWDLSVQLMFLV